MKKFNKKLKDIEGALLKALANLNPAEADHESNNHNIPENFTEKKVEYRIMNLNADNEKIKEIFGVRRDINKSPMKPEQREFLENNSVKVSSYIKNNNADISSDENSSDSSEDLYERKQSKRREQP